MQGILTDITSLMQYLTILWKKEVTTDQCPHCGMSGLWRHGGYPRKADRSSNGSDSLNPIFIQRYYCRHCHKTCSVLPECIPPRRWYLWDVQQMVLALYIVGTSLRRIAKQSTPSRYTVSRWIKRFKEQFFLHKDALCHHRVDLGRTTDITDFWNVCFNHFSLAKAMRLCHVAGVTVP